MAGTLSTKLQAMVFFFLKPICEDYKPIYRSHVHQGYKWKLSCDICDITYRSECIDNKDHQRLKVDLMFMIGQNLRSFLTAVTPTAVAPIEVIFTFIYLYLPEFTYIYLNLPEFT